MMVWLAGYAIFWSDGGAGVSGGLSAQPWDAICRVMVVYRS
jgi:hypothetical protein